MSYAHLLVLLQSVGFPTDRIGTTSRLDHHISLLSVITLLLHCLVWLWGDYLGVAFEHVCVEVTVFYSTVGEGHYTSSVLNTFDPISFVARPVGPVHLTVSHSFIIYVVSMVYVAALPSEGAHAILLVVLVFTFKSVTFWVVCYFSPFSLAVFHTVFEFTCIYTSIFPLVDTFSFGFSHMV